MFCKQFNKFLYITKCFYTTSTGNSTSALAALRKKTGYTFANCKKALELHNNDVGKAEEWLKQQAQALGWSKATKLEGRSTKQGLVGIFVKDNIGTMVEVNCETDFVARNETFQNFVKNVSIACVNHIQNLPINTQLTKVSLNDNEIKGLKLADGKTLSDHLALMIGSVGENASLRRAICFKSSNPINLSGYAHPTPTNETSCDKTPLLGKYGSIIAFKSNTNVEINIQKNLCQHVIGMNPRKIGDKEKDEPNENKDDETCLIYQEYLMDPDTTVGEFLNENNIEIIDYQRFECGESLNDDSSVPLKEQTAVN